MLKSVNLALKFQFFKKNIGPEPAALNFFAAQPAGRPIGPVQAENLEQEGILISGAVSI